MFIKVKTEILKEFSKEIPKNVKNDERNKVDIIKIITDKKYLFIINSSKLICENNCLVLKTLIGLTCEIRLFIENLNKAKSLKNLIPELVEKKEPPTITKII